MNQISAIHNRLYGGPLARHLQARPYVPHITIGRGNMVQAKRMADEAADLEVSENLSINKLKIERIGAGGESKVLKTLWLK